MGPRQRTREEVLRHILAHSELDPNTGCLIWALSKDRDGYGHIRFEGKNNRTHRVLWTLKHGPIPAGMCVCHTCDRPSCNNVEHYWLGTNAENTHDRERKGRGADVEENRQRGLAQFASRDARVAMSRAKGGRPFTDQHGRRYETQREAAQAIGCRQSEIGRVLLGHRPHTHGFSFTYVGQ